MNFNNDATIYLHCWLLFLSIVEGGPESGVLGNDLIDLLGDFTGDPADFDFSPSFNCVGTFFVGETPFVVG